LLGTLGIDVRLFSSAEDFLSVYHEVLNSCLVTEIDLPGMSGLELQEHLQECGVSLPVIILASRGEVQLAVRAMRSGAVDVLEKPLVERALLTRVRQALDLEARR
jgi:FixJ family two-component response regulator